MYHLYVVKYRIIDTTLCLFSNDEQPIVGLINTNTYNPLHYFKAVNFGRAVLWVLLRWGMQTHPTPKEKKKDHFADLSHTHTRIYTHTNKQTHTHGGGGGRERDASSLFLPYHDVFGFAGLEDVRNILTFSFFIFPLHSPDNFIDCPLQTLSIPISFTILTIIFWHMSIVIFHIASPHNFPAYNTWERMWYTGYTDLLVKILPFLQEISHDYIIDLVIMLDGSSSSSSPDEKAKIPLKALTWMSS